MPAPPEFIALMQRFNQLGRLLPQGDEAQAEAVADRAKRAELKDHHCRDAQGEAPRSTPFWTNTASRR